ncbi:MAG: glycoside hydrolase family 3 C-terminal domain-containing protein [Clostridiales bacterium]|nr:glycoside hydrolase family 3 C-terminal domain-containing protein [Clostridiales bacterium]
MSVTKKVPTKELVKRIVLPAVAAILIAILAVGNYYLNYFAPLLHGFFAGGFGGNVDSEEARNALGSADELVGEIAEESMVLLKNDEVKKGKNMLPLDKGTKVNFFGWASTDLGFLQIGGGSGGSPIDSSNPYQITLYEAFDEYGEGLYNKTLADKYTAFNKTDADRNGNSTDALINPSETWYTGELMDQAYEFSDTAVVVLSRWGKENGGNNELVNIGTYNNGTYLELTNQEKTIFQKLQDYGFNVIVLLNTTNPIELAFLEEYECIYACMYVGIPGQSGARAVPELLYGESLKIKRDEKGEEVSRTYEPISPSGRLSDTYAYSWQEHNPSYINASGSNLAYAEGIYIGYRWYETADVAGYYAAKNTSYDEVVQFPFGYGLSYTTFEQEIVNVSWGANEKLEAGKEYSVTVRVTNTGDTVGREVVQLYYTAPYTERGIEKASVNLLAFDKTALLKPRSESETESVQEITLTFTAYDMASYDDYDKNLNGFAGYELDSGEHIIKLMKNAHEVIDSKTIGCDGIKFEVDPVTGEKVENRFTGDTAYANMPIDGSKGIDGGVTYLSRANAFANLPQLKKVGGANSAARSAADYDYSGYNSMDVSSYNYGLDAGLYLVTNSGNKASLDDLSGKNKDVSLEYDYDLMESLQDWDNDLWEVFLDQLSKDDIRNLIGRGGFQTVALESVGKTRCYDTDGPAGFNNSVVAPDDTTGWTVFPAETLTGCSWSQRLTYNIGQSQGQIGNATKVQGWYAPGVNLHRSVYNSRNYEYYSEDAVLSGKLAAETVRGAKEKGLYCYVKHFVISDNGQNAVDWYEWLTEQNLRENYLRAFEIVVKEGGANAMMSAFNKLGAVWCGYNHALLTDVLRTEWGFHGSVITDWYQGHMSNFGKGVKAGNDLWLNTQNAAAGINFDNVGQAYGARESAKGLLYTYIDTIVSAKQYQDKVDSGEIDDKYNVTLGPSVTAEVTSPTFIALWVIVDVVLGLGIAACVAFTVLSFVLKPKQKAQAEAVGGDVEVKGDVSDEPTPNDSVDAPTESEKKICKNCGTENKDESAFCKKCGSKME